MHNDVNDVIDRVAQELTAAQPPSNLRARVMDRIDTEPVRPRFAWHWKLALTSAAAAAIVFVIARQRPDTQVVVLAPRTTSVASATSEALAPTPTPASNSPARDSKRAASRATDRRIHQASVEELAWRERAITALTPVDALDLKDIQPAALSIPQLEVKPLGAVADGGSTNGGSTSGGSIDRHD